MQLDLRGESSAADGRGVCAVHDEAAVGLADDRDPRRCREGSGQLVGLRGAYDDAVRGLGEVGQRAPGARGR